MSAARRAARVACLLGGLGWCVLVTGAGAQDLERGRALYENHCRVCHTQKIHTRPNRMSLTYAEMRKVVDSWQREENLRWSAQEIDDVVYFLGATLYKLQ